MEQPLVSICCITYNQVHYIRQCIEGLLMQKTSFPFEIIINDDCSTDGTAEIIEEYASQHPHLIHPIYHVENEYSKGVRGMFATFCFPKARGKYVAMCEGDDYWTDPSKLQRQVDFMESHPDYSLCFHNAMVQNERVEVKERIHSFCYFKGDQQITTERLIEDWCIPTASILFRKSSFDQVELPRFFSGDYTLELALASVGKFHYIDRYMSVYRLNNGGVSHNISFEKWSKQLFQLLDWYDEYTDHRYHADIVRRVNEVKKNTRYIRLKDRSMLLPVICMPKYTLKMLRLKLGKISFGG